MVENEKKQMPKGGAKGGTRFPRLDIGKAIDYAKKLVSKTHIGPQPKKIIMAGVFNHSGGQGSVRISALKQYGLLEESQGNLKATDLAKEITSAPEDEAPSLIRKACLNPKIFREVYDAFQGDSINVSKIKQFGMKSAVHPDSADDFSQIVSTSLINCGLARLNGEELEIFSVSGADLLDDKFSEVDETEEEINETQDDKSVDRPTDPPINHGESSRRKSSSSAVQVTINLDSTMDAEKLEKMLKLLKEHGAL